MDFSLPAELDRLREATRRFIRDEVVARARAAGLLVHRYSIGRKLIAGRADASLQRREAV